MFILLDPECHPEIRQAEIVPVAVEPGHDVSGDRRSIVRPVDIILTAARTQTAAWPEGCPRAHPAHEGDTLAAKPDRFAENRRTP
jgi:hypothetical protein